MAERQPDTPSAGYNGTMEGSLAKEIWFGSAVADALDELQPADLALTLGGAPGQDEGHPDRRVVPTKAPRYGLERW